MFVRAVGIATLTVMALAVMTLTAIKVIIYAYSETSALMTSTPYQED